MSRFVRVCQAHSAVVSRTLRRLTCEGLRYRHRAQCRPLRTRPLSRLSGFRLFDYTTPSQASLVGVCAGAISQFSARLKPLLREGRGSKCGMGLDTTVGSVFIGYTVSLWLYGITLSQVGLFFHNNRNAPRSLKAVVWALLVLDNAQTIVLSHGIWLYVVPYRSWPQGLDKPPRSFGIMVYITSLNNLIVRCVFAYRIYKLSGRRILLPLVVATLSVTVSVLACVYGTQAVRMLDWDAGRDLAWMFYTGYACEFAADFLITSAMVFTFARRSIGSRRTKTLTQTLMIYFLNTGLLVMICVICSTIAYLALPDSFAFLAFYLALGKLYANTLLGSLNARDVLFPRASRELPQTTAPLLTSVVVLDDDNDEMFDTMAQEHRDTGGGSSFESDETRAEREKGKTKDTASVQEIETVETDAPPMVETRDAASARINHSKLDRQPPHPR